MKAVLSIFSLFLITCTQLNAQDVKKQIDAAKNNPKATQEAGKADAWQQKQLQQQQLKDTSATGKPTAVAPKKSKKHCGKPGKQ
jgi:hypothetical protein